MGMGVLDLFYDCLGFFGIVIGNVVVEFGVSFKIK